MRYPGAFALVLIAFGLAGYPALAATESPAIVEVAEVTRGSGTAVMKLPGTVLSKQDAQISAEVSGRLVWVAEVGEHIVEGEPLPDPVAFARRLAAAMERGLVG